MAKAITSDTPRRSRGRAGADRGLAILRYVNAAGDPRPSEIAVGLGLPRPTVYRLLQTLEEAGYIVLSPTSNRVRVTRLAAGLGDGFAITSRICQAAGTIFATYAPKVVWPLDISVYENAAMVIQETTHGRSPLSIDRGMTGFRLPMLRTAAGRSISLIAGRASATSSSIRSAASTIRPTRLSWSRAPLRRCSPRRAGPGLLLGKPASSAPRPQASPFR